MTSHKNCLGMQSPCPAVPPVQPPRMLCVTDVSHTLSLPISPIGLPHQVRIHNSCRIENASSYFICECTVIIILNNYWVYMTIVCVCKGRTTRTIQCDAIRFRNVIIILFSPQATRSCTEFRSSSFLASVSTAHQRRRWSYYVLCFQ